jgi:hypothetical protein
VTPHPDLAADEPGSLFCRGCWLNKKKIRNCFFKPQFIADYRAPEIKEIFNS